MDLFFLFDVRVPGFFFLLGIFVWLCLP